ncbi:MAG TPA: hypothetical protein VN152_12665 [Sphingopyxis sp.]|nr:hypothetical protein [Sphingopyxis sp.]
MSAEALEHAVYDLGTNRERRALFRDDVAAFIRLYALTAAEADLLSSFDVRAIQAAGVNAMACMGFWVTTAPNRSLSSYLAALRGEETSTHG